MLVIELNALNRFIKFYIVAFWLKVHWLSLICILYSCEIFLETVKAILMKHKKIEFRLTCFCNYVFAKRRDNDLNLKIDYVTLHYIIMKFGMWKPIDHKNLLMNQKRPDYRSRRITFKHLKTFIQECSKVAATMLIKFLEQLWQTMNFKIRRVCILGKFLQATTHNIWTLYIKRNNKAIIVKLHTAYLLANRRNSTRRCGTQGAKMNNLNAMKRKLQRVSMQLT